MCLCGEVKESGVGLVAEQQEVVDAALSRVRCVLYDVDCSYTTDVICTPMSFTRSRSTMIHLQSVLSPTLHTCEEKRVMMTEVSTHDRQTCN